MIKILIIDDDALNVEILEEYLEEEGFVTIKAYDGEEGWTLLQENKDVSLILLDRMMPKLDGISFMERLRLNLKNIPVIMQTAAADHNSIVQGINSGVYYYLTKPFSQDLLSSIVNSALNDGRYKKDLLNELKRTQGAISLISKVEFKFKRLDEAADISCCLAHMYPEPEVVILGISEILTNAVEHGNLGIGFEEKGSLLIKGKLSSEIDRRLELPENQNKFVTITLVKKDGEIVLSVKDCGNGFKWEPFMELQPHRADKPNGRGIMMAKILSFNNMEFRDGGREVVCTLRDLKIIASVA